MSPFDDAAILTCDHRGEFQTTTMGTGKKLDIKRISLETGAGKFFDPARKLFKRCDFKPCKPFAHYKEDVNSLYLSKLINNY